VSPGQQASSKPAHPVPLLVHCSTHEVGGAEASLLESVARKGVKPLFLVPAEGPLSEAVASRGWDYKVVPWPRGLDGVTQRRPWKLPAVLPGLPGYLLRLHREFSRAEAVVSSGVKSHGACVLLGPWHGKRIRYDIRDFIKPGRLRRLIAAAARRFGSAVTANSAAVAADYPGAEVAYPEVKLARDPVRRSDGGGKPGRRIITHLAYFAPYKGQDLFLSYAKRLLEAGLDAEFWIAGDVIYASSSYLRYRDDVYALAARLGLVNRVRFLGKVEGRAAVQDLLERTDLLLHCTREPEPFGRAVLEAVLCGTEAVCHRGSGVCEVTLPTRDFPGWMEPFGKVLGEEFVRVGKRSTP
jgi:glycosyltransferase involved in cell wall biosynthesis